VRRHPAGITIGASGNRLSGHSGTTYASQPPGQRHTKASLPITAHATLPEPTQSGEERDMATTHLVTAEELLEMGSDAPYELWEGVLKHVSPSSSKSSIVAVEIASAILTFVKAGRMGYVTGADSGYVLNSNPHTVVATDVGFFRRGRYDGDMPERGFYPMPPDLAVEVISPTDERTDVRQKQELYARSGVPLIWWVDPEARTVTVHQPGHEPRVLNELQTLDGGDVLPGFSLPVEHIFAIE
jgi:Uma2 family endonuclease